MNSIISSITRLSEREELLNFLDQLGEIAYNLKIDVKNYINDAFTFHVKDELIEFLADEVASDDREALSRKVMQLKEALKNMPIVKFTIPFEPRKEFVDGLSKMIREEFGTPAVLEFVTNQSLLGGAIIEGKDRIGRYEMSRYFKEKGDELLSKIGIDKNIPDI